MTSAATNRNKTYCDHGHAFTQTNTQYTRQGWRKCRACIALKNEKAKEERRATALRKSVHK